MRHEAYRHGENISDMTRVITQGTHCSLITGREGGGATEREGACKVLHIQKKKGGGRERF